MWVRKSEEGIKQAIADKRQESRRIKKPLIFAIVIFVVVTIANAIGYRGGLSRGFIIIADKFDPVNNVIRNLPMAILFGLIAFVIIYVKQVKNDGMPSGIDFFLCNRCLETQRGYLYSHCRCGGKLEPFAFFDDIEETATIKVEVVDLEAKQ